MLKGNFSRIRCIGTPKPTFNPLRRKVAAVAFTPVQPGINASNAFPIESSKIDSAMPAASWAEGFILQSWACSRDLNNHSNK